MKQLQKHFKALLCLLVSAIMLFTLAIAGCRPENDPPIEDGPGTHLPDDKDPDKDPDEDPDKDPDVDPEQPFAVSYRAGYTPQKFGEVTHEITELGAGVHLVANKLKKTNGQDVIVYAVQVDLKKANIVAGTKNNVAEGFAYEKSAPYAMAQAWEKDTGGHVYMSLNADFFGAQCVNAFVKDGFIIKDGHQDKGLYDYKNLDADVPASAPLLFGVKGTTAQLAPLQQFEGDPTDPAVKEQIIKAKFTGYGVLNGKEYLPAEVGSSVSAETLTLLTKGESASQRNGYAVKVDLTKRLPYLTVLEVQEVTSSTKFTAGEGYGWLRSSDRFGDNKKFLSSLKVGDVVNFSVLSPDGTWNGYETVLGCRQTLVLNDAIAETVKSENSNGAQSPDVPRSAVGIMPNGNVVIFAVESMYYGKKNVEGDTHGMDLPELAEFAYYYGCTQAANFDGGGSTQLVVRGESEETGRVVVRSSDTASTTLSSTRPVMNGILVTSRKEA